MVATSNGIAPATAPGAAAQATYSYRDLLDLELPPALPLVEGLLDEETGNIWGGPPNVGKTWLILTLGRAIASGTPWLGHFATAQGSVLIIDEESHLRGLVNRAQMLDAGDHLGDDLPLFFAVGHGIRIEPGAGFARLNELMTRHQPKLVVADSLTRVHGANENDAGQMSDVFHNVKLLMRAHGASFLFTDHVRKRGIINDPDEMLRGTTEKRAWPDSILAVEPQEQDRSALTVTHTKSRHSQRLAPFGVQMEIDELGRTARLAYAGAVSRTQATKANDIILAIHALQEQLGPDGADATTVAAWIDASEETVRRHVGKLVKAGIVRTRKATPSEKGGRPKNVYDVAGGEE